MKSRKLSFLILALFSLTFVLSLNLLNDAIPVNGYKGGIRPVIIIDAGHEQRFNHTHLQSAIQLLRDEFDANIVINTDNFTLTNLRGADLLIVPAPFIDASRSDFSEVEKQAVSEFYLDGGSLLYLANPYFFEDEMRNYSSNVRYVNDMMGTNIEGQSSFGTLNFNPSIVTLMNDFSYAFGDERFIYLNNDTFDNSHPIVQGFNNAPSVSELLTYATYIPMTTQAQKVIKTPITTYYVDENGEVPFGGTKNFTILVADEKPALQGGVARGVSCASGIMFSDLQITKDNTTTWFEAFDNALLWKNIIAWLLHDTPQEAAQGIIPDFGLFVISIIGIFFIMMVVGSILFTVGRETKRVEISEALIKMREREERRKKVDEEIEEAYFDEEIEEIEATITPEKEEELEELDMKSISEEVKKKPPKTRSRSERRRRR
ncbi:MAG: GldG family protein [Candidatus Heimdallarchaeota archaeon]|nr:GldG family protein [Candidatus Heimdallarchaeota archaeon]